MSTVETTFATIENASLPQAFKAAAMVALKRGPKPILGHIMVSNQETVSSVAIIEANNLETGFRAVLPGCWLPHGCGNEVFSAIPRTMAETIVKGSVDKIEFSEGNATAGGATAVAIDGNEFPRVDLVKNPSTSFSVPLETFRTIAKHVGIASDDESSRYALGGVLLETRGSVLRCVATDGRRLHAMRVGEVFCSGENSDTVVPMAALKIAIKAIAATLPFRGKRKADFESALLIDVRIDDMGRGEFCWTIGQNVFSVTWRKIEGRFPRWRDVFPGNLPVAGTVSAKPAAETSTHCRKNVCSEQSKGIDVFSKDGNQPVSVAASSNENGSFSTRVDGSLVSGFHRKLDPRYFAEGLLAVAAATGRGNVAVLGETESDCPVFLGEPDTINFDEHDNRFAVVIMPLAAD